MPDYTRYPDADDIADKLRSSKLWPFPLADGSDDDGQRALYQADIGARGAARQWEKRVPFGPFLKGYGESEPQGAYLRQIEQSQIRRDGTLHFRGYAQTAPVVTMNGAVAAAGQYRLLFKEQIAYKAPYTGIRFLSGQLLGFDALALSETGVVNVTAQWGRVATVPEDVWLQVQQFGALIALTSVENLQNIASIGQDGFNKAFDTVGVITQQDLLKEWGKDFLQAVKLWRGDVLN